MKTYAGYNNNKVRDISSSGGIFGTLALEIIKRKGVVYGVRMSDDNYYAYYERVTNANELYKILGSKYFQVSMKDTYKRIKEDLLNGRIVLFSGTICQVNGLLNFLGKSYENLICVDIICHGVPSYVLWKKYIQYREKTIGKCNSINFRSKKNGWYESGIEENSIFTLQKENDYMNLFLRDLCLRPSCYECTCKSNKQSDITLGDFWGVNDVAPEMNDDKGLSVIFVRTDKGSQYINYIEKELIMKEITYEQAILDNPSEYSSVRRPGRRRNFYRDLKYMPFSLFANKYLEKNMRWRVLGKIKTTINKVVKKIVK